MGKTTFRRVIKTLKRAYVTASLPVAGGVLFTVGSAMFVPGATEEMLNSGAICFLVGSGCYWAAPFLDYWEFTHNAGNLLDTPPNLRATLSGESAESLYKAYEHLYKAQLVRMQRTNCLIYMMGGIFFVGGSVLFFPSMEAIIMHGGWLYITGCCFTLLGALLAAFTASELQKTSQPLSFKRMPPPLLALPSWSDEAATVASCMLYVVGNLAYIVGSVFFFPRILEIGGEIIRVLAVLLFLIGSVVFTLGALVDLIVVARQPLLESHEPNVQLLGMHGKPTPLAQRPAGACSPAPASSQNVELATPPRIPGAAPNCSAAPVVTRSCPRASDAISAAGETRRPASFY
jgi:hypothetical protein